MDNLQELLKDLRDIHEPEAISAWPPAIGWWLLPIVILVVLYLLYRWWKKASTPNYKKLALQEFKNIKTNYDINKDSHGVAGELALLIRKAMVAKYGNEEVAGLIEEEWLYKLDTISHTQSFSDGPGRVIVTAPYAKHSDVDVDGLFEATHKLLRKL